VTKSSPQKKQKKINFSVARQTRRKLIEYYEEYPEDISLLKTDSDNLVMWEMIFVHFFGEMPIDVCPRTVPDYYRVGSTDPRWDILFFNMYALSLHRKLVKKHHRLNIFKRKQLEAA
jgi:hypothetical protein